MSLEFRVTDVILLLCGPPGSGKTTLATRVRDRLAARGHEFELLHSDDFSRRTYDRLYEHVVGTDADWILDGTFYKRKWQTRFRTLEDVRFVWVRASRETALVRNRAREDSISERGLHVVHATFDEPRADLTLDTDECSVEESMARLEAAALSWLDGECDGDEGRGRDEGLAARDVSLTSRSV